jgi:hypothetical protein
MEEKDIYILLVFALLRWRRPARLTPERGQFCNKDEAAGALACGRPMSAQEDGASSFRSRR